MMCLKKNAYGLASLLSVAALFCFPGLAWPASGEVAFNVEINAPEAAKDVRLWLPYPVSDAEQEIDGLRVSGNFTSSGVYREKDTGNLALYAEWTAPSRTRSLSLSFRVSTKERVKRGFPKEGPLPVELKPYLEGTRFLPTGGKVRETALLITKGKKGAGPRARAVYDWVVENTFRDPDVPGCGTGDVERMLAVRGGKCVDISSVFVAIARAAGVPAREVFGLRLGKKPIEDITAGYHCWAEFYYPGYGWVPVDPADVRKAMLAEGLDLSSAGKHREYFFGAVDEHRVVLARGGRGYYLSPPQKAGPVNYFMYPYAEVDGKPLDWLAQKELRYSVNFRALN